MIKDYPMSILVLGASYGLAVGIRTAIAGHHVDFVCLPEQANMIRAGRFSVRVSARNAGTVLDLGAADCARSPGALTPLEVDAGQYDLVLLAMQEPQYAAAELSDLVRRIGASKVPCISVMNMPLPLYLADRLGIATTDELLDAWQNPHLWMALDPALFTAASPDPQAIPERSDNRLLLNVTLPSNLKIAPFSDRVAQEKLQRLARDTDAAVVERASGQLVPRVRLVAHPSPYVPMAKWPMLLAGNFRCFRTGAPVSIARAVLDDIESSRSVYAWVSALCIELIGDRDDFHDSPFVAFDRYCVAASSLSHPSSIARGIANGAVRVERVDKLLQLLGRAVGTSHPTVDSIVAEVDRRLAQNKSSQARMR